jgi:hypothetical protein
VVTDANGNTATMDASGTKIEDANGNTTTMDASGITLEGPGGNQVIIGASGVKVGSNAATEPFVLGLQFNAQVTSFLTSLGTHTHVGNLGAPTSPPIAPMTLQVPLSSKHMVE